MFTGLPIVNIFEKLKEKQKPGKKLLTYRETTLWNLLRIRLKAFRDTEW